MAVDQNRHPHYGGRKRPDTCVICERTLMCYVTDDLEDRGEPICPQCIVMAIDIAWLERPEGPAGVVPHREDDAPMWAYLDEDCPARGPALSHTRRGGFNCIHCGARTYLRRDAS